MERAVCAHERAGQLEIGARVDEQPGLFVAEAEASELVEAPGGDALILGGQLERGRWLVGGGHVLARTSAGSPGCWQNVRRGCGAVAHRPSDARVRVARASERGAMADYTIKRLHEVEDVLGDYPGEMRMMTGALGAEQVAFSYRRMPQHTGGKGSYGHRHKEQEEVYFVASGKLQFKVDDEVVELEQGSAIRIHASTWRSVWNDEPEDAELIIVSKVVPGGSAEDAEYLENFWPE